jgi:hypothetical protein
MNLKEALAAGMKQDLFNIARVQFQYDRELGQIKKVVSSAALARYNYVLSLEKDEAEKKKFIEKMRDRAEVERFNDIFRDMETVVEDTTYLMQGKYPTIRIGKVVAPVSHIVWFLETGEAPEKLVHIDGDHSNTSFSNLTKRAKGVSATVTEKKYPCRVTVGDQVHYIGTFNSVEERNQARDRFCLEKGVPIPKPGRPVGSTSRQPAQGSLLKPYQAVVMMGGRQYHLGRYDTREEVRKAREAFRERHSKGKGGATFEKPAVADYCAVFKEMLDDLPKDLVFKSARSQENPATVAQELPAWMTAAPVAPVVPTTSQELPEWMR